MATVVDRTGMVGAVAFSGEEAGDQWPGSCIISAQKANTANGLSLDSFALSTANLYAAAQPGGSLYGIDVSNPVNAEVVYGGHPRDNGTERDHMVGRAPGGVNVFGGGLPLYAADGKIVGGLGCSGDYSCGDHNIAWKVRYALELDYVPGGVDPVVVPGKPKDDNIIFDIDESTGKSASGWGHPACPGRTKDVGLALQKSYPVPAGAK